MNIYGKTSRFEPSAKAITALAIANLLYFSLLWLGYTSGRLPVFYSLLVAPFFMLLSYALLFQRTVFVWLLAAAIPLSVNIENLGMGVGISIPGEIMLMMLAGIFLAENLISNRISKAVYFHPITLSIAVYLFWLMVTLVFSTMPVISAKFVLMKLLFVIGFFFLFVNFFQQPHRFYHFMWLLIGSLCAVVLYTTYNHSLQAFDFKAGFEIMQPFYENHGIYTATIAMVLPFVLVNILSFRKSGLAAKYLPLLVLATVILMIGIVFGHSRAAWLSLGAAAGFAVLLGLRVRFSFLFGLLSIILATVAWQNERIMQELMRVNHISGEAFLSHTLSSANVTTDVSNAERLNRWSCAVRMFKDKPLTGFGPGTFTFQYGPYQIPAEQTRISTPHPLKGDVHSEYLKTLTEGGVLGLLTFLAVVLVTLWMGMRIYYREKSSQKGLIALAVLLGLVTYFTHAFVNNYLETDKAASLVWIFTAAIVALDIKKCKKVAKHLPFSACH